jgi:hypothetical protein
LSESFEEDITGTWIDLPNHKNWQGNTQRDSRYQQPKRKTLSGLCRSGIIPSEYHDYYKSLPSSSNVDDKLADTDAEEEQADSDQEWD